MWGTWGPGQGRTEVGHPTGLLHLGNSGKPYSPSRPAPPPSPLLPPCGNCREFPGTLGSEAQVRDARGGGPVFIPGMWATGVRASTAGFACPLTTPSDPQAPCTPQPGDITTVQTPANLPTLCSRLSCDGTSDPRSMARNGSGDRHPGPLPTVAGRPPPIRPVIGSGEEGALQVATAWVTSAPEMERGRASHSPCAPSLPSRLVDPWAWVALGRLVLRNLGVQVAGGSLWCRKPCSGIRCVLAPGRVESPPSRAQAGSAIPVHP